MTLDQYKPEFIGADWFKSPPTKITVKARGIAKVVIVRTKANGGL